MNSCAMRLESYTNILTTEMRIPVLWTLRENSPTDPPSYRIGACEDLHEALSGVTTVQAASHESIRNMTAF